MPVDERVEVFGSVLFLCVTPLVISQPSPWVSFLPVLWSAGRVAANGGLMARPLSKHLQNEARARFIRVLPPTTIRSNVFFRYHDQIKQLIVR